MLGSTLTSNETLNGSALHARVTNAAGAAASHSHQVKDSRTHHIYSCFICRWQAAAVPKSPGNASTTCSVAVYHHDHAEIEPRLSKRHSTCEKRNRRSSRVDNISCCVLCLCIDESTLFKSCFSLTRNRTIVALKISGHVIIVYQSKPSKMRKIV